MRENDFTFIELDKKHVQLLYTWLQEPHVLEFWDDGLRTPNAVEEFYFVNNGVKRWIFAYQEKPIGYIQFYFADKDSPYYQFQKFNAKEKSNANETVVGIDLFIGDKSNLGKGLASLLLMHFIKQFCTDADVLIVDPQSENVKAIHLYEKLGFKVVGKFISNKKQNHLLMALKQKKVVVS